MSSIIMSEEFLAKAKAAKSFEELKAFVSAEGVEVADSELMDAWERISQSANKGKFKLSEEELDNVAGGCGEDPHESWDGSTGFVSNYNCPACGTEMYANGTKTIGGYVFDIYTCPESGVSFKKKVGQSGNWYFTKA